MPERVKDTLVRKGSTVKITKEEGDYTVVYGTHITPIDPKILPAKYDALALETGDAVWTENPLAYLNSFRHHIQYEKVFEKVEKDHIPVLFLDSFYRITSNQAFDSRLISYTEAGIEVAEALLGLKILNRAKIKNDGLSRRRFLTKTALTVTTAWLFSPFISPLIRGASTLSNIGIEASAEAYKVTSRTHPEIRLLLEKVRNVAAAYKQQKIMEGWAVQRPHFVSIWGGAHVGIEDEIQSSLQAKLDSLTNIRPLLQLIAQPTFYQAVRFDKFDYGFDYKGNLWDEAVWYEFPELKELIN